MNSFDINYMNEKKKMKAYKYNTNQTDASQQLLPLHFSAASRSLELPWCVSRILPHPTAQVTH